MDYVIARRFARFALLVVGALLIANSAGAQRHADDAAWHSDGDVVSHHAPPVIEPAACQCENGKQCPGVCRDPGHPAKPKREKPGDVDRGDCLAKRYRICDCQRAGNPQKVAPWAKCGITEKYSAWFVGGGAAFKKGRPRKPGEGTFGMDYSGLFGHANIWLKYTRDRKQGGEGAYETDGEPEFVGRLQHALHR